MTPKLLSTRLGVKSNVTLSFSRKRYKTGPLTLNIPNLFPKNSMRNELQKNLTFFNSFAKVSNRQSKLRYNSGSKNIIVEGGSSKKRLMLKQRPAFSYHQSYMRWISTVHVVTNQLTPSWPSDRPLQPETPTTTSSKNPHRLRHRSSPTPYLAKSARPPTKRLGERRKSINI